MKKNWRKPQILNLQILSTFGGGNPGSDGDNGAFSES